MVGRNRKTESRRMQVRFPAGGVIKGVSSKKMSVVRGGRTRFFVYKWSETYDLSAAAFGASGTLHFSDANCLVTMRMRYERDGD